MHKEENSMSAIIKSMRMYLMFDDDELDVLLRFKNKLGLTEEDMVRMAITITCEKISNKDPEISKADALMRLVNMCEDMLKDDDDTDDGCSPVFVVA